MSRLLTTLLLLLILPLLLLGQQKQNGSDKDRDLKPFWTFVQEENGYVQRAGFANQEGKIVVKAQFSKVKSFSSGLAPVAKIVSDSVSMNKSRELWGYLNTEGKVVIPFRFTTAERFEGNHAFVKKHAENYLVIDRSGTIIKKLQHSSHEKIDSTLYRTFINYYPLEKRKVGLMDSSFTYIIKPRYNWVKPFSDGLAAVSLDWQWGYINQNENFVIEPIYEAASSFHEGEAMVREQPAADSLILINGKGQSVGLLSELIDATRAQEVETYSDSVLLSCLQIEGNILARCTRKMFGEPEYVFDLTFLSTPEHTKAGGSRTFQIFSNGIVLEETSGYESYSIQLELPDFNYETALTFLEKLAKIKGLDRQEKTEFEVKYFGNYGLIGVKKIKDNLIGIYSTWSL